MACQSIAQALRQIIDTIAYLHGYRIRDIAIAPTGDTLFLAIDSTGSTSGPTGGFSGVTTNVTNAGFILRMVYIHTLPLDDSQPFVPNTTNAKQTTILVYPNLGKRIAYPNNAGNAQTFAVTMICQEIQCFKKTAIRIAFTIDVSHLIMGVYVLRLYNGYGININ